MWGWLSFGFLLGSVALAFGGLLFAAPELNLTALLSDGEIWRILRFTLWQACLSTALSLVLAIPFARALARRQAFWGRRLLIQLSSLSLVIPSMLAVFGIAVVYGRNGWLNQFLAVLGFDGTFALYGLNGIVIAHLFFNLPLATRVCLAALQSLPAETWRLSSQLGLPAMSIFRLIEWPLLRSVLPGVAGLIFMLCFTSFAIILTLGRGPKYVSLEVAIYQAFRFDFDLARGVLLALMQIMVCLLLLGVFSRARQSFSFQLGSSISAIRPDAQSRRSKLTDAMVLLAAALFLLSPLLAVVIEAINPAFSEVIVSKAFLQAMVTSCLIALAAGLLALLMSLPIAFLLKNLMQKVAASTCKGQYKKGQYRANKSAVMLIELGSSLILLVPPLTLGMGLFLLLRPFGNVLDSGIYLVILVNALLAVPFVLRVIQPAVVAAGQQIDRLSLSLGVINWQQFSILYWPQIRQPVAFALALAVTLSLGDMGVIALFATQDLSTLPLLIYRLFGAYQIDQAAVVAVLLCAICAVFFWGIERVVGGWRDA